MNRVCSVWQLSVIALRRALCAATFGLVAGVAMAGNNTLSVSAPPPSSANAGGSVGVTSSLPYAVGNDCGNQVRIVVSAGSCSGGSSSWTGNAVTCTSSGSLTRTISLASGALTACVISVDGRDSNSSNGYPASVVYTVKINQSIAWTGVPVSSDATAADYAIVATPKTSDGVANTNTATTYTSTTPGVCTVTSGGVVHNVAAGTCSITAAAAGDANFSPASSDVSWAVNPVVQSITVMQPAPVSAVNGEHFNVTATATSGLPVAITASGGCAVNNAVVTMTSGSNDCTVNFDQAGDGRYLSAHDSSVTTAVPTFSLDGGYHGSVVNEGNGVQ